ncbi:Protein LURP-one-related 8 [Acorus gramineus]|uniref:Protein LURP-one-related 8 n=1 Tax=Acorus gramineus TaxID=55184 RepID=A0AAV9BWQ3_ACOGR|nr:Protein LURP-one-related 8 [Acorus gramineus]
MTQGEECDAASHRAVARGVFPHLCSPSPTKLTVWRKSLLFNSRGYTVYDDSDGRIVFRVDNYAHNWREEAFLMDPHGHVLLTVQRCKKVKENICWWAFLQMLSMLECWEAYKGDKNGCRRAAPPVFKATKALGNPSCTISVAATDGEHQHYKMYWSRRHEWTKLYRASISLSPVAEVSRKCGGSRPVMLGKDVFSLRLQPGLDQAMVMAMIMIIDVMK